MIIIDSQDGSHSLRVSPDGPAYHSVFGAVTESKHIFINNGFLKSDFETDKILEIGLGTALNAFLTLEEAMNKRKKVFYTAIEKFPVPEEIFTQLNYADNSPYKEYFLKIHYALSNTPTPITDYFTILKLNIDLKDFIPNDNYTLIYFDAFAPEDQPEMWTNDVFEKIYSNTVKGGKLLTYCSKGIVKQALRDAGFVVKRFQGPPGKHHAVMAVK